jgi:aryl-alcohol dehydrogenase-like predicted oxidoreductase
MPLIGHSDLDVFPLALGGNVFGWTVGAAGSEEVLDKFVAGGGNFVDTADGYSAWVDGNSGGESETIIGNWMSARGNRDSVVVGTKVSQHPDFTGLSAGNVAAAADASLARLKADHIDLYYAHFDDPSVPLEETVGAFNDLVVAGKVRWVGVSNYSGERITEWIGIAKANGWALPVALQPHYNLVHREPYETELAPVVKQNGLAVVPYFALAAGFLTGKYLTKDDLAKSARGGSSAAYLTEEGLAVIDALQHMADARETRVAEIALAWLLSRPGVVAPIASARTPEQLDDLLSSTHLELTGPEIERLNQLSSRIPA